MQAMTRFFLCVVIVVFSATAVAGKTCGSIVGRWGYGPSRAVASSEDLLFFGSEIFLQVAEIRSGGEVAILAELELPDIKAADGLFYIADNDGGFRIFDPNTLCREPLVQEIPASHVD